MQNSKKIKEHRKKYIQQKDRNKETKYTKKYIHIE